MGKTAKLQLPYPELADTPDVPRDIRALAEAVETGALGRFAPLVSDYGSRPVYQHDTDGQAGNFPIRLEWRGQAIWGAATGVNDTATAWSIRVVKINGTSPGVHSYFTLARNDGNNSEIGPSMYVNAQASAIGGAGTGYRPVYFEHDTKSGGYDLRFGAPLGSSRKIKTGIRKIADERGGAPVLPDPVLFRYSTEVEPEGGPERYGFIAEDVPALAQVRDRHGAVSGVDDRALIALLTAEVRRLAARVEALEAATALGDAPAPERRVARSRGQASSKRGSTTEDTSAE